MTKQSDALATYERQSAEDLAMVATLAGHGDASPNVIGEIERICHRIKVTDPIANARQNCWLSILFVFLGTTLAIVNWGGLHSLDSIEDPTGFATNSEWILSMMMVGGALGAALSAILAMRSWKDVRAYATLRRSTRQPGADLKTSSTIG